MRLVFLFIKIYPFFGFTLAFLCMDLARSSRRRGKSGWVGLIVLGGFFVATILAWAFFRGDKNADIWFRQLSDWLAHA